MQLLEILPKKLVGETGVEPAASWSLNKNLDGDSIKHLARLWLEIVETGPTIMCA